MTQKNRVFANALVGGYGNEKSIERQNYVLVTYRRSLVRILPKLRKNERRTRF